ncbi:hypothetical protein ACOMHN_020777 [Nucella lapillus]
MDVSQTTDLLPVFLQAEAVDWTYNMRREMQEIIPGLYLGPYSAATKSELGSLTVAGITHIVCVRQQIEASHVKPNFPQVFKYLVLDIGNNETENIIQYFPQVNEFLLSCLKSGGRALVHGVTGTSRSAALVQAFLMMHCGLSCAQSYLYIHSYRYCIYPNPNFVRQLEDYEPICAAYHSLRGDNQAVTHRESMKRKWEEEESPAEMDKS